MRLWRADRLADELREGRLQEVQKFQYVLASAVLHYIVGPQSLLTGPRDSRTVAAIAIAAVVAIVGLTLCFRSNQRGDGRQFLERYVCLAVPSVVRVYVIGYALYYLVGLAAYAVGGEAATESFRDPWGVPLIFGAGLLLAYFATLRHYVGRAAGGATA